MVRILGLNLLLFLHVHLSRSTPYCSVTDICPPDKPFCTDSGCVFECPKSAYINGTYCVVDCGDWFVKNGKCVDHCPLENFTRETPRLIGREIYIEKHCVSTCSFQEYIFNISCVRACPGTHRHIDGRRCVRTCPENASSMTNFTINEIIFHKCVNQCQYFVENGYCTDQCSVHLFAFNHTCVSSCPNTHQFIFERNCVQKCPDATIYVANNTCMSECPMKESNLYKGKCVSQCPSGLYKSMENNIWHCVENCSSDMLAYNQTCVSTCPDGTVIDNKTCAYNCSVAHPFSCEVKYSPHSTCGAAETVITYPEQRYTICINQCPDTMYDLRSSCVDVCPADYNYLNTSCVQNCPDDFPYLYNKTVATNCNDYGCSNVEIVPVCLEECPLHTYSYNKVCYIACPSGLYTSAGTCVTTCDKFKPFTKHKTLTYDTYEKDTSNRYWSPWRKKSKEKASIVECVANCGPEYVRYNTTCGKECPENIKYMTNRTCHEAECRTKYMYNKSLYIECSDVCENSHFIYHKQCLKNCPEHMRIYNRTCVTVCPDHRPFVLNQSAGISCSSGHCESVKQVCVETCTNDTFVLNQTCVPSCPKDTFVHNKTCVSVCLDNSSPTLKRRFVLNQSRYGIECLSKCPKGKLVFNQTCYKECPKGTYSLDDYKCVYTCPSEKPLGFIGSTEYDPWRCIRSCEKYEVFENGSCKYSCTDHAIAFEGKCIEKCPEGYFWFGGCYSVINEILTRVLALVGIDIVILFIGRQILKEYFIVVWMSMCCRRFFTNKNRTMKVTIRPVIEETLNGYVEENDTGMHVEQGEELNLLSFDNVEAGDIV